MPSAIIRERAMSSCSLVIPTSAARGLCDAASDWVGSFAITIRIRRQHKIARPRFNLPLSHHRCDQEIAEARATRFATPLSQLRRLVELATCRTNYKFLRQSNFLTIRGYHVEPGPLGKRIQKDPAEATIALNVSRGKACHH